MGGISVPPRPMLNAPEMTAVGGALGYARSQARSAGTRGLVTGPVSEQALATNVLVVGLGRAKTRNSPPLANIWSLPRMVISGPGSPLKTSRTWKRNWSIGVLLE